MPTTIAHLQALAQATTQYLVVWAAITIWDTLATLPAERRYIWPAKWTPLKVVYFLNRYGSALLFLVSTSMIVTPTSPERCRKIYWIQPLNIVFTMLMIHLVMSIRLFAIYERSRAIGAL
ncbi:hypothetical protein JCM10212_005537 [Sporobolomyces blumeae]